MLHLEVVRLAAYRRGSRPGRRPDGSSPTRQPTRTVGHFLSLKNVGFALSRSMATQFIRCAQGYRAAYRTARRTALGGHAYTRPRH